MDACSVYAMTSNVTHLVSPDNTRYEVAAAVRAHLGVHRISDSALGRAIGMSQSMISRRTNGEIAFDTDDLGRIASHLGVSIVELIQMPTATAEAPRPGGGAGARGFYLSAPPLGLEPRTCRLTAGCSAN